MQCTLAHLWKFVRASCVNFHALPNTNKGQIRSNWISHLFTLNTNFLGHQFAVENQCQNGRNDTVFALRICRPPSWMRERVRSRIKSRPGVYIQYRVCRWPSEAWRHGHKQLQYQPSLPRISQIPDTLRLSDTYKWGLWCQEQVSHAGISILPRYAN